MLMLEESRPEKGTLAVTDRSGRGRSRARGGGGGGGHRGVKRTQVCDRIRDMILRGELRPGQRLRQKALAEQCGVAQGVVREALLELERCGLVVCIERRGVRVASFDRRSALEALDLREIHEAYAVRRCCERATRLELRQLAALAERIQEASRGGRDAEAEALDHELHGRLLALAGNAMLLDLSKRPHFVARATAHNAGRDGKAAYEEHLAILQAISDGRADDAERLVRQHIARTREALVPGTADATCAWRG